MDYLQLIVDERNRQLTLPGSEFDETNGVNDWLSIASHYLTETAKRKSSKSYNRGNQATISDYQESLIKAAAVILAALEHSDVLVTNGELQP